MFFNRRLVLLGFRFGLRQHRRQTDGRIGMTRMGKLLDDRDVEAFRQNGFHPRARAMAGSEARRYLARLEAFEASRGGPLTTLDRRFRLKTHLLSTWTAELVRHSRILDAVEDLLGPNLLCPMSTFFVKEGDTPTVALWHQDATYFGWRPYEHVMVWLALTDAPVEAGCMEFLPGSRARGQLHHHATFDPNSMNTGGQTVAETLNDASAVPAPLAAGEFSIHHTHCIHRSLPNRSPNRRIGLGISYLPTHVRHIGTIRQSATIVRGVDEYGHFDPEPRPTGDFDEATLAMHERLYAPYRRGYDEQIDWHGRGIAPP